MLVFFISFALIMLGIMGIIRKRIKARKTTGNGPETDTGDDDGNGLILDDDGVLNDLVSVLRSLEKQRASGYRSWLSSCIERLQHGNEVPPEVALQAMYFTRRELAGGRFNLCVLDAKIAEYEDKLEEWD